MRTYFETLDRFGIQYDSKWRTLKKHIFFYNSSLLIEFIEEEESKLLGEDDSFVLNRLNHYEEKKQCMVKLLGYSMYVS